MGKSIYGVWDGVVHDFRRIPQGGQITPVEGLDNFDPNNPTKAFIADRGFFVFSPDTSLVAAFAHYMKQAARESCGRCTPCRVGTQRLRDLLLGFPSTPEAQKTTLAEIEEIARQVTESSLCGMGQSCAKSLLAALRHFPDEFKPLTPAQSIFQHSFIYTTAPCIEACPSKIDVPKYIDGVKGGKFDYALGVILDKYPLAATCGRVCVRFCETACRRNAADGPVAIRLLKRYAADQAIINQRLTFKPSPVQHEKRVAIVGAGPAGITCAYKLLLKGIKVDIFDAQNELLIAKRTAHLMSETGQKSLFASAENKLRLLDVPESTISKLRNSNEPLRRIPILAPQDGVITAIGIREGMYISPETELYTITNLDSVWVLVDVFDQQMDAVKVGNRAEIRTDALPGHTWEGKVDYLYPDLVGQTRTLKARIQFPMQDATLKPNMFVDVRIDNATRKALAIPQEAIIPTADGARIVKVGSDGAYVPVDIKTGLKSGDYVEVLDGLKAGDEIVVSGQFLLDSESNLQASFRRLGAE